MSLETGFHVYRIASASHYVLEMFTTTDVKKKKSQWYKMKLPKLQGLYIYIYEKGSQ